MEMAAQKAEERKTKEKIAQRKKHVVYDISIRLCHKERGLRIFK